MKTIKFGSVQRLKDSASASKLTLKKQFNLTKEHLALTDIIEIVDKMKIETEKSKDIANKLYNDLDKNKNGFVDTEVLIDELVNKKEIISKEEYAFFYSKINEILHSKSDSMISKLKRIRSQQWIANDHKSLNDIQWIISALTEKNLYEINTTEIAKQLQSPQNNEVAYLAKCSGVENASQKEHDYYAVRRKSKLYSTLNLKTCSSMSRRSSVNSTIEKRRSTDLNSMVSPSVIAKIFTQLCRITQFDFNIFELDELLRKKATLFAANEILGRFDLVETEIVEEFILRNFLTEIIDGYSREAVYHNDLHAGDVMQTAFAIVTQANLQNKMKLGQLDIFAILIAAVCHDYKHTGQNNQFHINSKSKLANRYNDQSVLENYHIAQTMKTLYKRENNIFCNFPVEEFRTCKRRMIGCIFATDMAKHQSVLGGVKLKGDSFNVVNGKNFEAMFEDEANGNVLKLFEAQQSVLNLIVHLADVSNPGKPEVISDQWTKRVYEEFFRQGDLEKKTGLEVSMFCDRETTNINKAMIGFITFVVAPTIDVLFNLIPEVRELRAYCKANLVKHQVRANKEVKNANSKR